MKNNYIFLFLLLSHCAFSQDYRKVHNKSVVIDTHNDILTVVMEYGVIIDTDLTGRTHTDLSRWKEGGLDVQFFSVWSDGTRNDHYAFAMRQLDSMDAVIGRNPDKIVKVANSKEMLKVVRKGKIAAMAGLEGGHQIEDDLNKLDTLFMRGVRYMTLTWNNSTSWASSAFEEKFKKDLKHRGLTDFGKKVVQHMNELGMMVDISHVGEQTFWDVINTTSKPVIASHSSVYSICPHQRNLTDDQIKAVAKNGGVIQVNFYSGFIDSTFEKKKADFMLRHQAERDSLIKAGKPDYIAEEYVFRKYKGETDAIRPPFDLVIQHIEYIIRLAGVDHVGLGSDFDGIESAPVGLDDVRDYPRITEALLQKGYTKKEVEKILGGNLVRVLRENER